MTKTEHMSDADLEAQMDARDALANKIAAIINESPTPAGRAISALSHVLARAILGTTHGCRDCSMVMVDAAARDQRDLIDDEWEFYADVADAMHLPKPEMH